jgi:hypothetical protein
MPLQKLQIAGVLEGYGMNTTPITLKSANDFVKMMHRHHGPVVGHKFSVGVENEARLVGVAIVGRPVSRMLDDGKTCEVNRLATDGTKNVNSLLYAVCRRIAFEMGYRRIITYILDTESGVTLRAASWIDEGLTQGGSWSHPSRPREDKHPLRRKRRYSSYNHRFAGKVSIKDTAARQQGSV